MNKYISTIFLTLSLVFQLEVAAEPFDYSSLPSYSQIYDPERNAYDDGRAALSLARETNRRVIVEIGGDWCVYCHQLDALFRQHHELSKKFFNAFVLLKVNVSDENKNTEFLSAFSGINGYPHIFVTETNGKVLHSQDTTLLRENKQYSVAKFEAFIEQWKPDSK